MFPDVSVKVRGILRPATDCLRGPPGCFGTLVIFRPLHNTETGLCRSNQHQQEDDEEVVLLQQLLSDSGWPQFWVHWPLHAVAVAQRAEFDPVVKGLTRFDSGSFQGVYDSWGLLAATLGGRVDQGVLVRPDGIIAAVGGPEELKAWLGQQLVAGSFGADEMLSVAAASRSTASSTSSTSSNS
jgi:hypothetical protein